MVRIVLLSDCNVRSPGYRIGRQVRWLSSIKDVRLTAVLTSTGSVTVREPLENGALLVGATTTSEAPYPDPIWARLVNDDRPSPFRATAALLQATSFLDPDVVFAAGPAALPASVQVASWSAAPLLYDSARPFLFDTDSSGVIRQAIVEYERLALPRLRGVIAATASAADAYRSNFPDAGRWGIEPTILETVPPAHSPESGSSVALRANGGCAFVVGCRPLPATVDLEHLIRGFLAARVPDTTLVVPLPPTASLLRLAEGSPRVQFAPEVTISSLVATRIRVIAVFPHRPLSETMRTHLPEEAYEALALGVPIVANASLGELSIRAAASGGIAGEMGTEAELARTLRVAAHRAAAPEALAADRLDEHARKAFLSWIAKRLPAPSQMDSSACP